jgi:hypothetical protein
MTREGKFRLKWVVGVGVIGYLIPAITGFVPHAPSIPASFSVLRILVPVLNITAQYPVDPDWPSVLFFFGPINAVLYGVIGLLVSQFLISRWSAED